MKVLTHNCISYPVLPDFTQCTKTDDEPNGIKIAIIHCIKSV